MHAAPESALLRESVPQSRAVTAIVAPESKKEEEKKKNEIAGIPILWLIIGGALTALGLVAVLAMVAITLIAHEGNAPPTATTSSPTVTSPQSQPQTQPQTQPSSEDEDRDEHHPPPPPGKHHGHGKPKP
jgi:hypothetical protein